jgi:hypothetical protein
MKMAGGRSGRRALGPAGARAGGRSGRRADDGSVLPARGGANSALTIMAVAARAADHLIAGARGGPGCYLIAGVRGGPD